MCFVKKLYKVLRLKKVRLSSPEKLSVRYTPQAVIIFMLLIIMNNCYLTWTPFGKGNGVVNSICVCYSHHKSHPVNQVSWICKNLLCHFTSWWQHKLIKFATFQEPNFLGMCGYIFSLVLEFNFQEIYTPFVCKSQMIRIL